VDRGHEATGGAIEGEASILPRRALTQSGQPLHVTPDRTGIRLVRFRQRVRLSGLLLRPKHWAVCSAIESPQPQRPVAVQTSPKVMELDSLR